MISGSEAAVALHAPTLGAPARPASGRERRAILRFGWRCAVLTLLAAGFCLWLLTRTATASPAPSGDATAPPPFVPPVTLAVSSLAGQVGGAVDQATSVTVPSTGAGLASRPPTAAPHAGPGTATAATRSAAAPAPTRTPNLASVTPALGDIAARTVPTLASVTPTLGDIAARTVPALASVTPTLGDIAARTVPALASAIDNTVAAAVAPTTNTITSVVGAVCSPSDAPVTCVSLVPSADRPAVVSGRTPAATPALLADGGPAADPADPAMAMVAAGRDSVVSPTEASTNHAVVSSGDERIRQSGSILPSAATGIRPSVSALPCEPQAPLPIAPSAPASSSSSGGQPHPPSQSADLPTCSAPRPDVDGGPPCSRHAGSSGTVRQPGFAPD